MNIECAIERVFSRSVDRIQAFYGSAWARDPILDVADNGRFYASAMLEHDLVVRVSTGCFRAIEQLDKDCSAMLEVGCALEWLISHELHHADLTHFEFLEDTPSLHLVSRSKRKIVPIDGLPKDIHNKVAPCLELQADHEAIELMLDSYSTEGWGELRSKTASITAVMALIEKHDAENQIEHSTHPKAATRIFQLLGHVTEMWSLPAHAKAKARGETTICENDLPSDEEKQAFSKEVILPAFWDAVALAEVAKVKSIISDLGSPEDFFADISRAKLGHWNELVTGGAIEWAELKDANDLILPLLPINQETN